jgi:stringent starvation protein B
MKLPNMTSQKPYLLRALYDWILDNHLTPYIVIDVHTKNVRVPMQYVQDGKIILDISAKAVHNLTFDNHYVNFKARFGAASTEIYAPINAVLAIYAHENGAGIVFDPDDPGDENNDHGNNDGNAPNSPRSSGPPEASSKPKLTLIKS